MSPETMVDALAELLRQGYLRVHVKPGKRKNSISFDQDKQVFVVEVKAPAQEGKANEELVKFLSREFKRQVRIKSGHSSKDKMIT